MIKKTAIKHGRRFKKPRILVILGIRWTNHIRAFQRFSACCKHFTIRNSRKGRFGEKYYVPTLPWTVELAAKRAHAAFSAITPYGIAELFARDKSSTTVLAIKAVVLLR